MVLALSAHIPRGDGAEPKPVSSGWASFRHDLAQTGVASSPLPTELELLWEVSLGDQILATAAIVGDFVYVPCLSGELVCLDRKTGARVWAYKTVEVVEKNSFAPGFKSTPTVAGDSIYLGDEEGVMHAIHRQTGKVRWKFATGGEIYIAAAINPLSLPASFPVPERATGANTMPKVPMNSAKQRFISMVQSAPLL